MMPPNTVAAVVVTHDPDERFTRLIEALIDQVDTIRIVDNGSQASILEGVVGLAGQSDDRITVISNLQNHGLAAAQNQGDKAQELRGARGLGKDCCMFGTPMNCVHDTGTPPPWAKSSSSGVRGRIIQSV